jgi:hypothetical protein
MPYHLLKVLDGFLLELVGRTSKCSLADFALVPGVEPTEQRVTA